MLIKEFSLRFHLGSKDFFNLMFSDLNKKADLGVHLQFKLQVSV